MPRLDRRRAISLAAGILCLVALSIAAGTIASPVIYGDDGVVRDWERGDSPIQPGERETDVQLDNEGPGGAGTMRVFQTCVKPLNTGFGMVGYFGSVFGGMYLIYRRWSLSAAMLSAYGILPVATLAYFLLTACIEGADIEEGGITNQGTILTDAADITLLPPESAPLIVGGILGAALLGAALLIRFNRGEDAYELDEESEDTLDDVDLEDFAEAARQAADRLGEANVEVDNEVHRAWREMTGLLHVDNPATSTPREFAQAASDAGIDAQHVDELTRLFEDVRYGRRDPKQREEQAVSVFRSIKDEYSQPSEES